MTESGRGEKQSEVAVERVYWTVVGNYGYDEVESYSEAVDHARSSIQTFDYGHGPTYSRAFIALRQRTRSIDSEVLRWEVMPDAVALVPSGQGGLTDEQRDALTATERAGRARR